MQPWHKESLHELAKISAILGNLANDCPRMTKGAMQERLKALDHRLWLAHRYMGLEERVKKWVS